MTTRLERELTYPVIEYPAGMDPSWRGVLNRLPGAIWDYEGAPYCVTHVQVPGSLSSRGYFCIHFSPACFPNEGHVCSFPIKDPAPFSPWAWHISTDLLGAAACHPVRWSSAPGNQPSGLLRFYSLCEGIDEIRRLDKMFPNSRRTLPDLQLTTARVISEGDLISHFYPGEDGDRRINGILPGEPMVVEHISAVNDREPPEFRQYVVSVQSTERDLRTVLRVHETPNGAVIVDAETLDPLSFVYCALVELRRGGSSQVSICGTKPPEISPLVVTDAEGATRAFGVKDGQLDSTAVPHPSWTCMSVDWIPAAQYTVEHIRARSQAGELFRLHPDCRPAAAKNGAKVLPALRRLQLLEVEVDRDIYRRTMVVVFAVCEPGREDSYWYLREETPRVSKYDESSAYGFCQHLLVPFDHPLTKEEITAANDRGMEMHDRGDGVVRLGPLEPTYTSPFHLPPAAAISLPDGECGVKEEEKGRLATVVYREVMEILGRGPTDDERRWIRDKVKELTYLMPYAAKAEAVNRVLAAQADHRRGMRDAPITVGTVTGRFSSEPNTQGMPKISEKDLVSGGKMSEEQSGRTTKSFTEVLLKHIGERTAADIDAAFLKLSRDGRSFEKGKGSTISDGGTTIRDRFIAERWKTPLFKPVYCKRCGHANGCMHRRRE